MPQQSFDQTEEQYADARIQSLVAALNADGGELATFWHSGGGVMVCSIDVGDGFDIAVGLANYPLWGYDVSDTSGDHIGGESLAGVTVDSPAFDVARALADSLWASHKVDIRE